MKPISDVPFSLASVPEFKNEAEISSFGKLILANFASHGTTSSLQSSANQSTASHVENSDVKSDEGKKCR